MEILIAMLLFLVWYWRQYRYQQQKPISTQEWLARMRKLHLGVK